MSSCGKNDARRSLAHAELTTDKATAWSAVYYSPRAIPVGGGTISVAYWAEPVAGRQCRLCCDWSSSDQLVDIAANGILVQVSYQ